MDARDRLDIMIRLILTAAALLTTPLGIASAEEADLSGNWAIATSERQQQPLCALTGKATLSPATSATVNSDYECELTMRHACEGAFEVVVRQSCRVRNIRGQITVQSSIVEHLVGENRGTYSPDNFRLSVQSANELYGAQIDAYGSLTAIWTRADGSIS